MGVCEVPAANTIFAMMSSPQVRRLRKSAKEAGASGEALAAAAILPNGFPGCGVKP
jgi:hypothetical protein